MTDSIGGGSLIDEGEAAASFGESFTEFPEKKGDRPKRNRAKAEGEGTAIAEFQDEKSRGRPILTIDTLRDLLIRLKVRVRYNVISKEMDIIIPGFEATVENYHQTAYAWLASHVKATKMDLNMLDDFLLYIAEEQRYNPVTEWIGSKPWDGHSRLGELYDTIEAEDDGLKEKLILRWLLSCVAAAFEPSGLTADGMLVLQGDQGIGKTWWFRKLFPDQAAPYFKDGLELDPRNKDSTKKTLRHWVVELGELDGTLNRTELASLKAFITSGKDVMRMVYARREREMVRRTALCATVNNPFYLKDPTGNRRFWTVACKSVKSYHEIDAQQLWAEVYVLYQDGEKWALNGDEREKVRTHNYEHEILHPAADRVKFSYDWKSTLQFWLTPTQIADEIGFRNPDHAALVAIGSEVIKLNGGKRRRNKRGSLLFVPRLRDLTSFDD